VLRSSVVATHIALLSGKQCGAPFASLGQAHWSPSAVVWGDGGGGRNVSFFLWLTEEEVLVWVGSMVMDRFGALLWFCGCSLSWSLRRRFVGCSLGRLEVVVVVNLRVVAKDTGLCAWLLVPVITSMAKGTSGPPAASREPLRDLCHSKRRCAKVHVRDLDPASGPLELRLLRARRGAGLAGKKNRCFTWNTTHIEKETR